MAATAPNDPAGLSLVVANTFTIEGRGTVLTGAAKGTGVLRVGDTVIDGGDRWEVYDLLTDPSDSPSRIGLPAERVAVTVPPGEPGPASLGVLVKGSFVAKAPPERSVSFAPRPTTGVPTLTGRGWAVPDQMVPILLGRRARSAVLVLEGLRVRLLDAEGAALVDAPGTDLRARAGKASPIFLSDPSGGEWRFVGPVPLLARRPEIQALTGVREPHVFPPAALVEPLPARTRLLMPDARLARRWQPVLLAMLRTRGVQVGPPPRS